MPGIRWQAAVLLRVAVVATFAAFAVVQVVRDQTAAPGHRLTVAALALAVAGCLAAAPPPGSARREKPPVTVLGIPVRLGTAVIASIGLLVLSPDGGLAVAALLFTVGAAAFRHPPHRAVPVGLLALTGLLLAGLAGRSWEQELPLAVNVCVILLIAYAVRQRRATRAAEAREAVLAERARIAREIHDVLAHSLSAQIVHLEGARLLLRAERHTEALERVEHAGQLARSGLEEARRAVSALREDSPPLPAAIEALTEEFRATTGQACPLTVTGPERRLAPETELAVVRTAQEALTNVGRHAPGAPATVRLAFAGEVCELEVTNPSGSGPGTPGGGYGLVGMAERAELLGGALEAGETDGGFRVRLRLPAAERPSGRSPAERRSGRIRAAERSAGPSPMTERPVGGSPAAGRPPGLIPAARRPVEPPEETAG
ncbi:sensor histidine kinase [Streptosporangium sp. NPDC004379]|uniref:sensor histidine kinase n=1 Tax=Streptosporangium sp. NPDC004379 TaxID=3366189 RepID=UPI0036CA3BE7